MIVLDASAVLKRILPSEENVDVSYLLDQHRMGVEHIVVPSLLQYEVGNVLRYEKDIPDVELTAFFNIFGGMNLTFLHPSVSDMEETILYAREKDISVYDAAYVVLARRLGCSLVTADKKLANRISEAFVQLL